MQLNFLQYTDEILNSTPRIVLNTELKCDTTYLQCLTANQNLPLTLCLKINTGISCAKNSQHLHPALALGIGCHHFKQRVSSFIVDNIKAHSENKLLCPLHYHMCCKNIEKHYL